MNKVSIIMGIFNCESTLGESIDSLLNQTYDNWELIMCDDGSSDRTYDVAKCYSDKYPDKIKLIRNETNIGLNETLNKCLTLSKGEFIARMDGDDISLPTRLEEEIRFLNSHPEYSIVSTPMMYFDDNGIFKVGKQNGEPNIKNFAKGTQFCHAPCMVRKEAYESVCGYSICHDRLRVEDWDLWVRMYEKGYRGYNISTPLYMMRDDRKAFSRRKFKYRINEFKVSISAVNKLKLPKYCYVYSVRPIIVGLLPNKIYSLLHKK